MQREKATATAASFCVVVVAAVGEETTFATPGEPPLPQPAASSANATTATTELTMMGHRRRICAVLSVESKGSSPPQPERVGAEAERLLRASLRGAVHRIEAERDARPSAVCVSDGDAAPVVVDGLFDDREPEPGAGQGASRDGTVEAVEDVRKVGLGDTGPAVAHR